jgi:hypothetical protein
VLTPLSREFIDRPTGAQGGRCQVFDFIRKSSLWKAWDAGLDKDLGARDPFHLKSVQDLSVYSLLKDTRGLEIAEIGGGDSRVLRALAPHNKCYNVDKFAGDAGGPSKEIKIERVHNIKTFLGEFS